MYGSSIIPWTFSAIKIQEIVKHSEKNSSFRVKRIGFASNTGVSAMLCDSVHVS